MTRFPAFATAMVAMAFVVLAWWLPNRPEDGGPAIHGMKFNSLSFAPYRAGESPSTKRFPTYAEAEKDLALIAPLTRGIRTYAAYEGDWSAAELAAPLGLKVWQGVWLGSDLKANEKEIARAIHLANTWPNVIDRVVVGNEVLLRGDLTADALTEYIDRVRAAVRQPVTYADVAEFWEKNPAVAEHVDIVTVHLLPYWEDKPAGISAAVDHAAASLDEMISLFPRRRIAVGEAGWPSAGRARSNAVPGRLEEAKFVRTFVDVAARRGVDYNLIEAFDQQWKAADEGTVGANWGIFDAGRHLKFPMTGPVEEDPWWRSDAAMSLLVSLILLVPVVRFPSVSSGRQAAAAFLAVMMGGCLGFAAVHRLQVDYDPWTKAETMLSLAAQSSLAWLVVKRAVDRANLIPDPPSGNGEHALNAFREVVRLRLRSAMSSCGHDDIWFLVLWWGSVEQLLLVFTPRYMDFPMPLFAVPLLATMWSVLTGAARRYTAQREEIALGLVIAGGAIASAIIEGPLNLQSLEWNAAAFLMSSRFLAGIRLPRPWRTWATRWFASG